MFSDSNTHTQKPPPSSSSSSSPLSRQLARWKWAPLEPGVAGEQGVGPRLVHRPDPLAPQVVGDFLEAAVEAVEAVHHVLDVVNLPAGGFATRKRKRKKKKGET